MTGLRKLAWADAAIVALWAYQGQPASPLFGLLHLAMMLGAAVLVWRGGEDWNPWNWHGLAFPLGVLLGVPGIVVFLRVRPWGRRLPRRIAHSTVRRKNVARRMADEQDATARLLDGRVSIPEADNVESLRAILRNGPLERRCAALQAVVRSFEPALTPLVAIALSDPDQTVRALAAATSAQVSANLAERIAHMEAQASPNLDERYDFAMLLLEHGCRNVLLSQSQAANLRDNARARLVSVLNDPSLPRDKREAAEAAMSQLARPRSDKKDVRVVHIARRAEAA